MRRSTERILTTHCGSLPRPAEIADVEAAIGDAVRRQLEAGVLGRENVIAGVDCGLDTVAGVHQVDPEIAWAKLAALAEGARLASERLWA
jgi:methionine synthase II (cobalamin-independent)